jgi:AhpD family alkylhydroperoxidase
LCQSDEANATSTLEPELRELVKLRVSQINRCAYCIIYHRRDALKIGVAERKIHLLNACQEASEYSDRERAALAWAEAVTLISVRHLPDEIYEVGHLVPVRADLTGDVKIGSTGIAHVNPGAFRA